MTQPHYDPDPLYVEEPDSDEAHYEAAAAYFDRLDVEPYDHRYARVTMLFIAVVIAVLAIIAAALLIGGGR